MNAKLQSQSQDSLYFTAPRFGGDAIFHGFFGRNGGVSHGIYSSLNMGRGSDDNPDDVAENFKIVAAQSGLAPENIMTLHQVHSGICVKVKELWGLENRPQADAFATDMKGVGLGILTADCAPVLFTGKKADGSPVIGAAHAGWKGAIGGALDSTVQAMAELGATKESISAAIGPCIAQASYEVDENFLKNFCEADDENERFFKEGQREAHYMFDLAGYCAARLAGCGVRNVVIKDLDTYFNEEDFFSYRRTTHRKESDYGRQISLIAIKV